MSQRKLAQMIGMDHGYLSKLESGQENPRLDTLTRIASGLDVSVARFFEGDPEIDYAFKKDV